MDSSPPLLTTASIIKLESPIKKIVKKTPWQLRLPIHAPTSSETNNFKKENLSEVKASTHTNSPFPALNFMCIAVGMKR